MATKISMKHLRVLGVMMRNSTGRSVRRAMVRPTFASGPKVALGTLRGAHATRQVRERSNKVMYQSECDVY